MLSPSDNLKAALAEFRLCTPQELMACEPEVRKLTGGLPGFDSCWLDVLVSHRLVTPWQSQCLQSANPESMMLGSYRLREPMGTYTWQAESLDRQRLAVISEIRHSGSSSGHVEDRTETILSHVDEVREHISPAICLPRERLSGDDTTWIVSPFVQGWRLDELLIRGGRIPWKVVAEIGRTLLTGMQQLHIAGLTHGDICLRNIRLRPDGTAVLVDPFIKRLLQPAVGFRTDMQLRDVQYCAPELAGTGRRHDVICDVYSLGSVLWQLLTARPTFLSADPIRFLMQCREQDVEDVRNWVPDCSNDLAHIIHLMTRRRPELRPHSIEDVLHDWPDATRGRSVATQRLLKRLPDRNRATAPVQPSIHRRKLVRAGWVATGVASCAILGLAGNLVPLPLTLNRITVTSEEAPPEQAQAEPVPDRLPLPIPDPDGKIELVSGQVYLASPVSHPGNVQIFNSDTDAAVIEVEDRSGWTLSADQIQLSGIHIRNSSGTNTSRHLMDVRCRILSATDCLIDRTESGQGTGLRWTPSNAGSTVIQLENTIFAFGRQAVHTTRPPDRFVCRNTLFQHTRTAWRCDTHHDNRIRLHAEHVTQVGGQSFMDVASMEPHGPASIELDCGDSVLTPGEAIVRLASTQPEWTPEDVTVAFHLSGRASPTVIPPGLAPAVWLDRSLGHTVELPESQLLIESLLMAELYFDSSAMTDHPFEAAQLIDFDGPKLDSAMPGVDAGKLPNFSALQHH